MCIAILQTAGHTVPDDGLWRGWTSNSHGAGYAYIDENDNLQVVKGFTIYNDFHKSLREKEKKYSDTSPFLIHMRYRTAGHVNKENTHPFFFRPKSGPDGAFVHNGTMFTPAGQWKGAKNDMKSDSRVLRDSLGNAFELDVLKKAKEMIEKGIGYNKLAFLYANKEYVIINEKSGFWRDGIWFSNNACDSPYTRR